MEDRYERYSRGGIDRSRNLGVIIMTLSLLFPFRNFSPINKLYIQPYVEI